MILCREDAAMYNLFLILFLPEIRKTGRGAQAGAEFALVKLTNARI